jgi:hypothetical protein
MLFSSLMISLCRVSISLSACFEMLESMMIWGVEQEAGTRGLARGRQDQVGRRPRWQAASWAGQHSFRSNRHSPPHLPV